MASWLQDWCLSSYKHTGGNATIRWRNFPILWFLCAVATASFATSFVLHVASVDHRIKFVFALISFLAACTVQRFSLLEIVIELSRRRQVLGSLVLESVLRYVREVVSSMSIK